MAKRVKDLSFDIRRAIHTPAEVSTRAVERVKDMESNRHRAMPFPIEKIAGYFADLMPGEICAVQAQSSNYKSGLISFWADWLAKYLASRGRGNEAIIHIDTENDADTQGIQQISYLSHHSIADLSRGNVRDWGEVMDAAGRLTDVEVYRISGVLGSDDAPDLYLSNIYRGIKMLTDGDVVDKKIVPACIFVDYLQALPIDPEIGASPDMKEHRRLQVRQDVYRLRRMAQFFQCPVVVGVQAKQILGGFLGPNMLIPGTYDGEETSAIAQRFDRIISMWMPKTTHSVGDRLSHKSRSYCVEESTLFLRVNKQRGGLPAGRWWPCRVDYRTNTIRVDESIMSIGDV